MKQIVLIFLAFFSALLAGTAHAGETIQLKRGLPTDIWLSWPSSADLTQAKFVDVFPEYRRAFRGDEFANARKAGFDFVRLPIDPAAFLANKDADARKKLLAGVRKAVDEILAADLKVVVDLHSIPRDEPGGFGTAQVVAGGALFEDYLKAVADVGAAIANYPSDKVAFEPINEPTHDCSWDKADSDPDVWPAQLLRMHGVARAAAPKLSLVFSGACWGGADMLVKLDPGALKDNNVLWSFHFYEPHIYTHQGASWTTWYERHVKDLHFPPDVKQKEAVLQTLKDGIAASDKSDPVKRNMSESAGYDLDLYFDGYAVARSVQVFEDVAAWAAKHKIDGSRIFVGEFGVVKPDAPSERYFKSRHAFYELARTEAEKRGFAWVVWSWAGSMGISNGYSKYDFNEDALKALGMRD
jgi:endoglucanase